MMTVTREHYYPLLYHHHEFKVDEISISKDNNVIFVEQFVHDVHDYSSQYGSRDSISYTAPNIVGAPSNFPDYGDFSQTFVMRTYGVWWDKAPSRSIDYMPQNNSDVVSQDYIDIEFRKAVYPIRVSVYETYNPGSVIRIWAQDCHQQWFLLWSGPPQIVPRRSRIFSPPLQLYNFKTKMLRLEFNHSLLDYYTELDAVLLIGTSELILPKDKLHKNLTNLLQSMNDIYPDKEDVYNLTPDYKNAKVDLVNLKATLSEHCTMYRSKDFHKSKLVSELEQLYHCIPPFKEGCNSMQQFLLEDFPKFMKDIQISNDSEEPPCGNFSTLPDETILKIFENLDLSSLYRLCRVNKHFNILAQDALLYTSLNLKPYWHSFDARALNCLASKCKYLQKLDLSWCGNYDMFSTVHIRNFIKNCGSLLTHLRLNCCEKVDDSVIFEISETCKNLKELCLRNCCHITDAGFSYLDQLAFLQHLDLYGTCIHDISLCKILQKNSHMRHLNIASVTDFASLNADEVAMELGNSCPDLESVDFWKTRNLTSQGIGALARCKNLREIDFSWCGYITGYGDTFRKLLSSCQHLEKIFLASFKGLTDRDLKELTLCKHLKQLDLLGALNLTSEICYEFLLYCPKLEMIDLSFCDNISDSQIEQWQQKYPHVAIKRIM